MDQERESDKNDRPEGLADFVGRRVAEEVLRQNPLPITLGTRIVCEDKEFIVINYSLIRDHAGYLLRFEANDPILALTRQMEQEKAREDRAKALEHQEKALKLIGRVEQELDQGEEWKRDKD